MFFSGYDGEITISEGAVIIKKGKKDTGRTIKFPDIISVTVKKPGLTSAGCIHIQVIGAKTYSSVATAVHMATDVNAICFRKPHYQEAIDFKSALDAAIAQTSTPSNSTQIDVDGLKQLKNLLEDGIITQEDFDQKKAQILGL
ncbi:MAG: SHOCT domain-containing protein [Acutalibacter sp.]|nr:SHOCT domain-containing protein [Acutalibacter sp.]